MNPITVIGCGPGHPRYLSKEAIAEIGLQENICGSKRLLSLVAVHRNDGSLLDGEVKNALKQIEKLATTGTTGVLVSGDPNVFSLAKKVKESFGKHVRRFVPGVSAGQIALNIIGEPADQAQFVSLHGRLPVALSENNDAFQDTGTKLFFMGGPDSYKSLANYAVTQSIEHKWVWFEDLTLATQQVVSIDPSAIGKRRPFSAGKGLVIVAGISVEGRRI